MNESQDFKLIYNTFLTKVENRLIEYISNHKPQTLYSPFEYIMSCGGKRIRPVLAMIAAGATGGLPEDALNSGCAVEILHNFTLVHDDIMDRSPMRRNKPTIHKKWNEATAILVGDVMVGYAYYLLPKSDTHEKSQQIIIEFTKALIEVCEGQAYDMDFNTKKDLTRDDYLNMIDKKTAKMLEAAAVIGGYVGHADDKKINALRSYANNLGIAFQIQDDLLDITANEAELGKTIGQDIVEGKKTYLIIKTLEKATDAKDKTLINKFFENNGLPKEQIVEFQDMFSRLGIYDDTQNAIDNYFNKALDSLNTLSKNQYTEMLVWLANSLNNRKF